MYTGMYLYVYLCVVYSRNGTVSVLRIFSSKWVQAWLYKGGIFKVNSPYGGESSQGVILPSVWPWTVSTDMLGSHHGKECQGIYLYHIRIDLHLMSWKCGEIPHYCLEQAIVLLLRNLTQLKGNWCVVKYSSLRTRLAGTASWVSYALILMDANHAASNESRASGIVQDYSFARQKGSRSQDSPNIGQFFVSLGLNLRYVKGREKSGNRGLIWSPRSGGEPPITLKSKEKWSDTSFRKVLWEVISNSDRRTPRGGASWMQNKDALGRSVVISRMNSGTGCQDARSSDLDAGLGSLWAVALRQVYHIEN